MTYAIIEESEELSQPVDLYLFKLEDLEWRYTAADGDVTVGGYTWTAVSISDDGIKQTGESTTDALTITCDSSIEPAQIYMNFPPSRAMQVFILRGHVDDDQVIAAYSGEVSQHNCPTPGTSVITVETISASMSRSGVRFGWQRTCPYALYDELTCKVDKTLWGVPGTVDAIDFDTGDLTINALAGQPDNKFSGGFVMWLTVDRGTEFRAAETQTGAVVKMFGTNEGLELGQAMTVYPGCDRTTNGCIGFNNLDNYGGVPNMPGVSPFNGDPVF
jgi:uncharacterized phage protein (TIGR02218 family)